MPKKILLITVGVLASTSLLAALFLVLNSAVVRADPSPGSPIQLPGARVRGRAIGREVTIVQPITGDILTGAHQPSYTVMIDAGMVPPAVVSVSVDGGLTYHQATEDLGSLDADYHWDWNLPDQDYERHLLIVQARYAAGAPRVVSDTAAVYVDTLPPHGTVLTVPAHAETAGFTVSWSAADGSGVITYDVEYRRNDQPSWTSWVSNSSETSRVFMQPLEGDSYSFRMRARDRGNNLSDWVSETVRVGGFQVYLPLVSRHWIWWYRYDRYEPNDTPSQAAGPLEPDTVYEAYIWNATDSDDYYHFAPPLTARDVEITLTNIPTDVDYDLYVYYYDDMDGVYVEEAKSLQPGSSDEGVMFAPIPLRTYYIRVFPLRPVLFSNEQPYHLELTYDVED
jgi:hypothetical protein